MQTNKFNFSAYLQLSRFDKPIGFWLLGIPCLMGQALGRIGEGFSWLDLQLVLLWIIGTIAMRGAGCTINDIVDKEFDGKVERTKSRPLPSGLVTTKQAYTWLGIQLFIGLLVLISIPPKAAMIAILSVPLVIAYPFMKRITYWPQAWLGITFNWGILVGFAAVDSVGIGTILFWLGAICWTIGYDTIYALSDVPDDELIGVKSTARKFGANAPQWVQKFYIMAVFFMTAACFYEADPKIAFLIAIPFFISFWLHLQNQVKMLINGEKDYNKLFRSNKISGLIVVSGLVLVALLNWYIEST